jgi:hypothetical protein
MKNKPINFEKKQLSNTVKDMLKKMLKERPSERLGFGSSLEIFRHEFFKDNEDLVQDVIKGSTHLKNIRYSPPSRLQEREEPNIKEAYIFFKGISYNYMRPNFDVTECVGPKFSSL